MSDPAINLIPFQGIKNGDLVILAFCLSFMNLKLCIHTCNFNKKGGEQSLLLGYQSKTGSTLPDQKSSKNCWKISLLWEPSQSSTH